MSIFNSPEVIAVLVFILMGIGNAAGMMLVSHLLPWFLGLYRRKGDKLQPYECGVPRFKTKDNRFSVKFYLLALMFVLFDIEAVFLFVFAVNFRDILQSSPEMGMFLLIEVLAFVGVLGFGLYYIIKRGVLDFHEASEEQPVQAGGVERAAAD